MSNSDLRTLLKDVYLQVDALMKKLEECDDIVGKASIPTNQSLLCPTANMEYDNE